MPNNNIRISVIIPTYKRPMLLRRAIASVLKQTFNSYEIIIVVDGPDPNTIEALSHETDFRIRVIELQNNVGGAEARNIGVRAAIGDWVAFLDDDDEWLPEKLETQYETALNSQYSRPIIACKFFARTPYGDYVWPRRLPQKNELVSDYLFARSGLFKGEAIIQTSVIMAKKELFNIYAFQKDLKKYHEGDWLLHITKADGVGLVIIPTPLSICYCEETRKSISDCSDWKFLYSWITSNKSMLSPKAYSSQLLIQVSVMASMTGDYKAILPIIREAIVHGKPRIIDVIIFFGIWLIPQNTRRWLRSIIYRGKNV